MSESNDRIELVPGLYLESASGRLRVSVPGGSVEFSPDEGLAIARALVEAAAAEGDPPEEKHWHRIPMQYLILGVEAGADAGEDAEAPPVEVHGWIKEQTRQNALHIAAGSLAEDGLVLTEVVEQRSVARADFDGTELLPYYDQALTDDEVFLYVHSDDEADSD
jgi:hypothetical protein